MYEWRLMDFDFPEELPDTDASPIIFLTYRLSQDSPFSPVMQFPFSAELRDWCQYLFKAAPLHNGGVILWAPIQTPARPTSCQILWPTACMPPKQSCDYYDNGYCLNGPEICPNGTLHPEVAID